MKLLSHHFPIHCLRVAVLTTVFVMLQGCGAYFNTYYNTKKLYKEAMQERKRRQGDKPSSGEIQKYDKTIEKASKLLQFHPNSKYVDDCLVLIGECFYYKQDYLKAQRKFQELITIFPKSGLVPHAQLWLGKTNIELKDYAGAERVLHELQAREKKGEMANQAQYYLGEIYFRQQQLAPAAKAFEVAARKLNDETMRGAAYMRLGESYMGLRQYDLAAAALRRAGATAKNDVDLKFRAYLQYAIALKQDRRIEDALKVLNSMSSEFSTHRDLPLVKLELAECARLQGKIESAVRQYTAIIEEHQRTDASAAAYFALGEIHERINGDFNKAKECYDNVRRESARSEKLEEATRRSKAAGDLIRLKASIVTLERQRAAFARGQSGALPPGADAKEKSPDATRQSISRIPRRALAAGAKAPATTTSSNDPTKVAAELAKNKILLAELYLFNFNRPDSAMREYLDVFEFFPQTEYAPQAMYSLAYILGDAPATLSMRDSILQVLAVEYSNTPQGQGAKRRLGQADTLPAPTLPQLLRDAEDHLVKQKDPHAALRLYEEFLQQQPETKLAAQSLYAMGWIYEYELSDNQQALATYKKLIENYPDSPMARQVRRKVAGAEQKINEPKTPEEQIATTGNVPLPPTIATTDTLQAQPEDSTAAEPAIDDIELISRRAKNLKQPPKPVVNDTIDDPQKEKKKTDDEAKEAKPPR